jgi:hypothetical protein
MAAAITTPDYEGDARYWDHLATVMVWNESACGDFRRLADEARAKARSHAGRRQPVATASS